MNLKSLLPPPLPHSTPWPPPPPYTEDPGEDWRDDLIRDVRTLDRMLWTVLAILVFFSLVALVL